MVNQNRGEELNQLSRLIFDNAANQWYLALLIELIAGILGICANFLPLSDQFKILFAAVGVLLLAYAYFLRLRFESMYDTAETMRRQSVLTESLGWTIERTQFSIWRQKAGKKILDTFKVQPRNKDYYVTKQRQGPRKLLEVTLESAFWTRHIYQKLQIIVWFAFAVVSVIALALIFFITTNIIPQNSAMQITYAVYLFIPIVISIDLLGWALKLGRLIKSIIDVERGLEVLASKPRVTESEVMRWISEYNCQVTSGFPTPNRLFKMWHDEIQDAWDSR